MAWRKLREAAVALALALAAGAFGIGTAQADEVASDCRSDTAGTSVSQGACVSGHRAGNPTALISGVCADPNAQLTIGTTNRGQCLKAVLSNLP